MNLKDEYNEYLLHFYVHYYYTLFMAYYVSCTLYLMFFNCIKIRVNGIISLDSSRSVGIYGD